MNEEVLKTIESSITSVVAEETEVSGAVDNILGEQLTMGIRNALSRGKVRVTCAECGMPIPVYPGRYPDNCPECGKPFTPAEEVPGEKEENPVE